MADISVNFMHPTDGRLLNVVVDDSMTGQEAIGELVSANFVASSDQGYKLQVKGGSEIGSTQSFAAANVLGNATIRVIPATDAGIGYLQNNKKI
jgi:hypothetical protein